MKGINVEITLKNIPYDDVGAVTTVKYETFVRSQFISTEDVNGLLSCLKCGINAFEDEVAERTEDKPKSKFEVNIVGGKDE